MISSVVPSQVSDVAARAVDVITNGAASDIACNGLTWKNATEAGVNLAMTLVPGGAEAREGLAMGRVAAGEAEGALSQAGKRRLAKRLGEIPRSSSPTAQGGSAQTGRWREYVDRSGRRRIVVEHSDGTVHVGRPKPQSTHTSGGPPKYFDDGNFGHVGE
jgi:hypothetical protein